MFVGPFVSIGGSLLVPKWVKMVPLWVYLWFLLVPQDFQNLGPVFDLMGPWVQDGSMDVMLQTYLDTVYNRFYNCFLYMGSPPHT